MRSPLTTSQSTFQNENLHVVVTKEPGCRIRLEVTATPTAAKASYQKAIASIRKEVSLPGFRKGKAPEKVIIDSYGKHIEKEWKDILLNTALREAIELVKIYPFNNQSIKSATINKASLEEDSTLAFEYEAAPEIPSVSPQDLMLPKVDLKPVTEQDVEATIADLCLQSGEWTEVTDRPAEDGDFVVIDIDDIGDPGRNIVTNSLFAVAEGKMGNWMRRLVVGMTPGQTAEGMSEKAEHAPDCKECADGTHSHEEHFTPTLCRITLHTIKSAKPHPLDDELAKKYGANNVQELNERVKLSLENRAREEQKDMQRRLIEKELFEKYPFDMPSSLVQGEIKNVRKQIVENLVSEGVKESNLLSEAKRIEQELAFKYERDFRLYFLTQKIAKDHNIKASKEEVAMEMMRQLLQSGSDLKQLPPDLKDRQFELEMQLTAVKALDFLIEKANAA